MEARIADLHVQIVRFVMDHQPPIVACEFLDAGSRTHTVIDKVWMFSQQTLDAHSQYPQPGLIRCAVLAEWRDTGGREVVRIDVANPDQIESTEGVTEFIVAREQVAISPGSVNYANPVYLRFIGNTHPAPVPQPSAHPARPGRRGWS
jgi:hypothetical protein